MAKSFCDCGRKIVVFTWGRKSVKSPKDNDHILCQKCWKSEQDRLKNSRKIDMVQSL